MKRLAPALLAIPLAACQQPQPQPDPIAEHFEAQRADFPAGRFQPISVREHEGFTQVFILDTRSGAVCVAVQITQETQMGALSCSPPPGDSTP